MSSSRPTNVVRASGSAGLRCDRQARIRRRAVRPDVCRGGIRRVERLVAAEDLRFQEATTSGTAPVPARCRARHGTGCTRERLRMPAASVQREHVLRPEPLPKRPVGDAPVQHADRADVVAERQPGIHENLERTLEHLVETGSLGRQRQVVGKFGEGGTAPPVQTPHRRVQRLGPHRTRTPRGLVHPALEPDRVDVVGVHDKHVATRSGVQRSSAAAQIAPESRHVALHRA